MWHSFLKKFSHCNLNVRLRSLKSFKTASWLHFKEATAAKFASGTLTISNNNENLAIAFKIEQKAPDTKVCLKSMEGDPRTGWNYSRLSFFSSRVHWQCTRSLAELRLVRVCSSQVGAISRLWVVQYGFWSVTWSKVPAIQGRQEDPSQRWSHCQECLDSK